MCQAYVPRAGHRRRAVELVVEHERRLLAAEADRFERAQDRIDAGQAIRARARLEAAHQAQHLARRRATAQDRVVGRVGRRLGGDQQPLAQSAATAGMRVVAGPFGDRADRVGHVEVPVRRAHLDGVAVAARRGVALVVGRPRRVVELEAVLRLVARRAADRVADRLQPRLVGRQPGAAHARRAQDERRDVVDRHERRHLVRADVVPDRLGLGLRARRSDRDSPAT